MTEQLPDFDYRNVSDRGPGPFVTLASRISPGVRAVQAQTLEFARRWRESNLAALAADGPLWVVLGDSLSLGLGAPAWNRGWVGQLDGLLDAAGRSHRIVNLAVSGARVADVLDRQLPELQRLADAADLVTVLVGSNDLVSRRHRDLLPERFTTLLEAVPTGTVVGTLPNPRRAARLCNEAIAAAVAQRGLVPADLRRFGPRSWRGLLAADHFHPNERGYASMTAAFADALGLDPGAAALAAG